MGHPEHMKMVIFKKCAKILKIHGWVDSQKKFNLEFNLSWLFLQYYDVIKNRQL